MSKRTNAIPWWGWLVWIGVIIAGMIAYKDLPSRIATHFDMAGHANGFQSRLQAVLFEPLLMFGIILLWNVLWRIDPRKRNYELFWSTYRYAGGVIVVFIGMLDLWLLSHALNIPGLSSMKIMPTIMGLMILLLANVLTRVQPNWWLGIRTPWTLSSEKSWRKTHRLAGYLGLPTGLLIIILAWVLPDSMSTLAILVPILIWALISTAASYFYAK